MNNKNVVTISIIIVVVLIITAIVFYSRKDNNSSENNTGNVLPGQNDSMAGQDNQEDNSEIKELGDGYAINNNLGLIYYNGFLVEGADVETFSVLRSGYAEDINTTYFQGNVLEDEGSDDSDSSSSSENNSSSNSASNNNSVPLSDNSGSFSNVTDCSPGPGVSQFGIGKNDRPTLTVCELGKCGECNF